MKPFLRLLYPNSVLSKDEKLTSHAFLKKKIVLGWGRAGAGGDKGISKNLLCFTGEIILWFTWMHITKVYAIDLDNMPCQLLLSPSHYACFLRIWFNDCLMLMSVFGNSGLYFNGKFLLAKKTQKESKW